MKITLPAGRYFVGDVAGLTPLISVPAISSVFYDDEMNVEIEIAGGGASCYDPDAVSAFGVVRFDELVEKCGFDPVDDFDRSCCFELTEPTEAVFEADYAEIVGLMKFSCPREYGFTFMTSENEMPEF